MYVQPVFIFVNVLHKKNYDVWKYISLKEKVVVSGDGYCFYRAVARWKDEISDEEQ